MGLPLQLISIPMPGGCMIYYVIEEHGTMVLPVLTYKLVGY